MAVKYNMREMNDLNGKGKIKYPQMFLQGIVNSDEIAKEIHNRSTLSIADIKAALSALSEVMSEKMGNGYSVKLEDIGIFTAALGIKEEKEREKEDGTHRNAQSIEISNINFRPNKEWIKKTNSVCRLERTTTPFFKSSSQYSLNERMDLAKQFIQQNGRMRIDDYVELTGLAKSTATRELRKMAQMPTNGLTPQNRGPLLHYVWKETNREKDSE